MERDTDELNLTAQSILQLSAAGPCKNVRRTPDGQSS
jgi:hypothetical protein